MKTINIFLFEKLRLSKHIETDMFEIEGIHLVSIRRIARIAAYTHFTNQDSKKCLDNKDFDEWDKIFAGLDEVLNNPTDLDRTSIQSLLSKKQISSAKELIENYNNHKIFDEDIDKIKYQIQRGFREFWDE